jgi:hypothetical protein
VRRLLVLVIALGACDPYALTLTEDPLGGPLPDSGIAIDDGDIIIVGDAPNEGGGADAPRPPADAPGEGGGADAPQPPADAPGEGGGTDAQPPVDAPGEGGTDAGIDAGTDAGLPDAGVPDAGVPADAPIGPSDAPSGTVDADPGVPLDASVDAPQGLNPIDDDGFDDKTSFYACSAASTPLSAIPLVLAIAFAIRRRRRFHS